MSKRADYQSKVNVAITDAQTATSDAWTFLITENRLRNLKKYQIKKINEITLLPALENVKTSTLYKNLSNSQKTLLYTLSQLDNYQDVLTKKIANHSKTKTEDSDDLLWLWITLPLFLVFLIFGLRFYFYRKKYQLLKKRPKTKNI